MLYIQSPDKDMVKDYSLYKIHNMVIPVNCVGVAGAGLAKWASLNLDLSFYDTLCRLPHRAQPGEVRLCAIPENRTIWAFTKDHWRFPSKLEWVESCFKGLFDLELSEEDSRCVIGVPALGCGLGGLEWSEVRDLAARILPFSEKTFYLYPPK